MSKTISNQIEQAQMLISGLRKNLNLVADKGIKAEFIDKMEAISKELAEQNKKVEMLQEEVSKEVKIAGGQYKELRDKFFDTKRIIKQHFPQEEWQNFGISDKR